MTTTELPSVVPNRRGWFKSRFLKGLGDDLAGLIGAILTVLILLLIWLGPLVWQASPTVQNLGQALQSPSLAHPFGTDNLGRDVLARSLAAGQISLLIGVASVVIGMVLGVAMGVAAGLFRGITEAVLMRLVDALLAIPGMVQALILVAIIGRGLTPLIIALGIYSIPIFARIAQQMTIQLMQVDYVFAARALGASRWRISRVHLLPNLIAPVVTIASFRVGANLLTGAALNFFGLGAQPPATEWGLMIAENQRYTWQHPLLTIAPGAGLLVLTLGLNLLGDGLRHRFDPKNQV